MNNPPPPNDYGGCGANGGANGGAGAAPRQFAGELERSCERARARRRRLDATRRAPKHLRAYLFTNSITITTTNTIIISIIDTIDTSTEYCQYGEENLSLIVIIK